MDCPAPLVSAILPVFNRAGSVARAIESVLQQSYPAVELIVVDDGSTDGTTDILDGYATRATVLRQDNRGAYAARNLALRHARGALVAFVDSDDAWLPDKLARQVPLMRDGVGLVYGDVAIVTEPRDGAPLTGRTAFGAGTPRRGRVLAGLAIANFVPTCTVLVRRSVLEEVGGFPEESRISADYLTWFRIARHHRFDFVPEPVALYTVHADGISFDLGRSLAARIDLFRRERARTDDAGTRHVLDRLLFNLGVHLVLAAMRGRAATVDQPLALARRAMAMLGKGAALQATAAFVTRQLRLRWARRVSSGPGGSERR